MIPCKDCITLSVCQNKIQVECIIIEEWLAKEYKRAKSIPREVRQYLKKANCIVRSTIIYDMNEVVFEIEGKTQKMRKIPFMVKAL